MEPILAILPKVFLKNVFIEDKNRVIQIVKKELVNPIIWYDKFKLD